MLDNRMFNVFVEECSVARRVLGMGFVRVSYLFGLPPDFPTGSEAGSFMVKGCGKALVFLNPDPGDAVRTEEDVKYLAWHEMLELLLTHRLKMFAADAARGKFDRAAWERRVHEVVHSLIGALKPDLMDSVLDVEPQARRDEETEL
jgi:hypothetical protein